MKNGTNGVHAKTNGVHAPARAAAEPLTAIDLAAAAVDAQVALLEDARSLLEEAEAARVRAEEATAMAEEARAAALQASDANRQDDGLADEAGRAGVRLEHARSDLARAVQAHDRAKSELTAREEALAKAKDAHEVAQIHAVLTSSRTGEYLYEVLEPVVAWIPSLCEAVRRVRERMAEDVRLVTRLRELGGASLPMPDTTQAAGMLARALYEHGGGLSGSEHELRWVLETPKMHRTWDANGDEGARKLLDLALRTLRAGDNVTGRERLERIGLVWSKHADRQSAERALAELDAPKIAASVEANRVAHEQQLGAKAERERRFAGFATRADGSPIGPCRVCGQPMGQDAVVDVVGQTRALRHRTCAAPTEMPVVDRPPAPPGTWKDGEYTVEAWVKEPTVG